MANINSNAGSNQAGAIPPAGGSGPGSSIGSNAGRSLSNAGTTKYVDPSTLGVDPNYPVPTDSVSYRPNRKEREVRRQVYIRYYQMRDNDWRTEAEHEWEMADKEYQLWMSSEQQYITTTNTDLGTSTYISTSTQIPDPDDTRSRLMLPDSFATIQSYMQEVIERRSRPSLMGTESSDEPIEDFANTVLTYNMNNTDFDYHWYMGTLASAIRGTYFYYDYYRYEKRWIKDVDDVDDDGNIVYKEKHVTDYDDDFTEWMPNEYIYVDEKARNMEQCIDGVRREILNIREFQRVYGQKKDFVNQAYVRRGGETTTRSFFKLPKDITGNDVEILHYYNRALDTYWVVANFVVIHYGPLPWKHKEIPFAAQPFYRVPGRFWGHGIPYVLHMLTSERTSLRNLNMDRQNLQINKMFLHNNMFDIEEEDLVSRPHGLISVDTNGLPLNQAIVPIEYGDTPPSYFKTDEMTIDDMTRASGIDTKIASEPQSETATAAALANEKKLKRINMLAVLNELETIKRIGRLKWANIQFFYPLGRMDTIYDDNEERQEHVYKTITTDGKKFHLVDMNGTPTLKVEDITGASQFTLNKKMAKYMEGSFDISPTSTQYSPPSKVVQQTKVTELFSLLLGNPSTMGLLDLGKSVARVLQVNDEKPKDWLSGINQDPGTTMLAAQEENRVMAAGQPLGPTPGATEEHTLVHIMFTNSKQYDDLTTNNPDQAKAMVVRQNFMNHIMGEHEANPSTNSAQQALSQNGMGGPGANGPQAGVPGNPAMQTAPQQPPGQQGQLPNMPALGLTPNPQGQPAAQAADIQPTNLSKPTRTGV